MALLEVEGLSIGSVAPDLPHRIVQGLDFALSEGDCLGIVGASGAGKTLTGLAVAGMLPVPLRITSGRVALDGTLLASPAGWRGRRGRDILTLLQSPLSALDPTSAVRHQVADALSSARGLKRRTACAAADAALLEVGLDERRGRLLPHQLSGGMRQRVLLAFARALRPRILIADEPTSGLDPIRQLEILRILRSIAEDDDTAVILVSHDLRVVAQMAHTVMVLDQGRQVEHTTVPRLLSRPSSEAGRSLASAFGALAGVSRG